MASNAVTKALAGRPVTTAGRTIRLGSVTVQPAAGGKLALGVSFVGDAKGTLRLIGTPSYDAAKREVMMPDVDFDLTTDNQLLTAYAWLRSDVLRATLRQTRAVVGRASHRPRARPASPGTQPEGRRRPQALGDHRLGRGEGPVCHPRRSRGARRSDGARRRGGEAALSRSATAHSVAK